MSLVAIWLQLDTMLEILLSLVQFFIVGKQNSQANRSAKIF